VHCWLVGDHLLLLRDFRPYVILFINVCVFITVATVWRQLARKGFWASWDNIHKFFNGNAVKASLVRVL
jgi:hypothetical protein